MPNRDGTGPDGMSGCRQPAAKNSQVINNQMGRSGQGKGMGRGGNANKGQGQGRQGQGNRMQRGANR